MIKHHMISVAWLILAGFLPLFYFIWTSYTMSQDIIQVTKKSESFMLAKKLCYATSSLSISKRKKTRLS